MIGVSGNQNGGIPLIVSVRNDKSESKIYEERLPYGVRSAFLHTMLLPDELRTYLVELYSYGIGKTTSVNTIESLSFQYIPVVWQSMKLVPKDQVNVNGTIVRTNHAFHKNWIAVDSRGIRQDIAPVAVDGWEQGWVVPKDSEPFHELFWPNLLAYLGYGLYGIMVLGIIYWQVAGWVRKYRT